MTRKGKPRRRFRFGHSYKNAPKFVGEGWEGDNLNLPGKNILKRQRRVRNFKKGDLSDRRGKVVQTPSSDENPKRGKTGRGGALPGQPA